MNIKPETKEKLVENNKKISELLQQNETLLREDGFHPPCENFALEYEERIHMPSGYIRTSKDFWNKYHLRSIVREYNTANNISYNLQLSDYYNLILNRYYVWGSIRTMVYKQDIINLVSILEALVTEATENIFKGCTKCKLIGNCDKRIKRSLQRNFKDSVPKLCNMGVLDFNQQEIDRIIELYNLRNRVHIRLAKENEFLDDAFCKDTHNEVVGYLTRTAEMLNEYAVPLYEKCNEYISEKN